MLIILSSSGPARRGGVGWGKREVKVGSLPPLQEPEAHDRFWPRPSSRSRSSLLLPASRPIAGGADVFMNICAPACQLSDHQASHMRRDSSGARSSMACVQETRYDSAKGRQQVQTLLSNVEAYHAMRLLERVRLRQITYSTRQHSFNPESEGGSSLATRDTPPRQADMQAAIIRRNTENIHFFLPPRAGRQLH